MNQGNSSHFSFFFPFLFFPSVFVFEIIFLLFVWVCETFHSMILSWEYAWFILFSLIIPEKQMNQSHLIEIYQFCINVQETFLLNHVWHWQISELMKCVLDSIVEVKLPQNSSDCFLALRSEGYFKVGTIIEVGTTIARSLVILTWLSSELCFKFDILPAICLCMN